MKINKVGTLKRVWKQWKATWELFSLLHCLAHSTINKLWKNWNQIHLYHSSTELNCVIATLVTALEPDQAPVSRKSWKLFGPEKPFAKLQPLYLLMLVFLYVVEGIKIKITANFRASRLLGFEDTKRNMSPKMRPKSFGAFEKQAPGPNGNKLNSPFIKGLQCY